MAGRRFDVADVVEVLRLWDAGKPDREIARSTGMGATGWQRSPGGRPRPGSPAVRSGSRTASGRHGSG